MTETRISPPGAGAIYMAGIPEANIASCYSCHGSNGEGVWDIPRLGGLALFLFEGAT
jgi:cytochrome c553